MSSERKPNIQGFDYEKYQRLRVAIPRMTGIDHLPPEAISKICADILVPHGGKGLAALDNIISTLEEELTDIRNAYEEKQFKPSSPRITAIFLDSQANTYIAEQLAVPLLAGRIIPITYLVYYDFVIGIKYTVNSIIMAEERIRGSSGFDIVDQIDNQNLPTDPAEKAEAALFLDNRSKQAAHLLTQDPTGYKLIHSAVQSLESESLLPDFAIRDFVVEGARHAQKAYGKIYPIAERINQK